MLADSGQYFRENFIYILFGQIQTYFPNIDAKDKFYKLRIKVGFRILYSHEELGTVLIGNKDRVDYE